MSGPRSIRLDVLRSGPDGAGPRLDRFRVSGGPRATLLDAAERVLEEPRGTDGRAVLGWVDDAHGAWRCHAAFECSAVCPAGVDPAGAIMRLRRRLLADRLPRLVGNYHREAGS